MIKLILSPAARGDLNLIWDYTAKVWGGDQANRYILDIKAACAALAAGSRVGRDLDEARSGYRKLSVGSHFVVYRTSSQNIDVVRILHQRMDISSRLQS